MLPLCDVLAALPAHVSEMARPCSRTVCWPPGQRHSSPPALGVTMLQLFYTNTLTRARSTKKIKNNNGLHQKCTWKFFIGIYRATLFTRICLRMQPPYVRYRLFTCLEQIQKQFSDVQIQLAWRIPLRQFLAVAPMKRTSHVNTNLQGSN